MQRVLMSRDAAGKLAADVARAFGAQPHRIVTPDDADAGDADLAFVSRDVTGLSTKHTVLPETQRFYDLLRGARKLRWVHIHSAGIDRPVYQELIARGVHVTTSSGANATVVAQSAVLGVLALARRWPQLAAAQHAHQWAPAVVGVLPRDLPGQTAVVVGWGPVGQDIARLLQAFGLRVIVARHSDKPAGADLPTVPYGRIADVLPQADWVVLACPLSDATRNLLGAKELALLPAHCGVVNVARGDVIDEAALTDALRGQRIGGAALDVFAHEPLPAASPLWDLPNVIVTPHCAGASDGNEVRVAAKFLANIAPWLRGELRASAA